MLVPTLAVLALLIAAAFLVRGSTPAVDTRRHPRALATLEPASINGTRQWLLIRTEDTSNPVALFVHGGPGTSQLTLMRRNTRELERHFTVVNWDQRGAAKSFSAVTDPTTLTVAQFVDDVIDLSTQLAQRFGQDRILLVGHSWGSLIGVLAAARRPDLFSAYVGIGQMSDAAEAERVSYEWTLAQASAAKDAAALQKLERIGGPPYTGPGWRGRYMTERQILGRFGGEYHGSRIGAFGVVFGNVLLGREYTMLDRINFFRGIFRSVDALFPEQYRQNLFVQAPELHVPVYFCLGRHDYEVPSVLAARYFEALRAPFKQLVWFEQSAHLPNTEQRDDFNRFMIETVLPAIRERAPTPV